MKDSRKIVAQLSGAALIVTFVTLIVGNVIFNVFSANWQYYVGIGDIYALSYILSFIVLIFSIILLCAFVYQFLESEIIERYLNQDKSNIVGEFKTHLNTFAQKQSEISNAADRLTDLAKEIDSKTKELDAQVKASLAALKAQNLVSTPGHYGRILLEHRCDTAPALNLTLVGTMAGFSFTVGRALPEYIAKVDNFTKLKIFTPARVSSDGNDDTILYAVFLILSTIREFIILIRRSGESTPRKLTIDVGYMKRDIFSAALMIPGHECIILPALKSSALEAIVKGTPLLGLRYHCDDKRGAPIYARYDDVLRGHERRYFDEEARLSEPNVLMPHETWDVSIGSRLECKVTVLAPRWQFVDERFETTPGSVVRDRDQPVELCSGQADAVIARLGELINRMLITPGAGVEFSKLLETAKKADAGPQYAFTAPAP